MLIRSMTSGPFSERPARGSARAACAAALLWLAGCAAPPAAPPAPAPEAAPAVIAAPAPTVAPPPAPAPPPPPPPPPAPPPLLPLEQAILSAANNLLGKAQLSAGPHDVLIDPLIDGMTGAQSIATRDMGERIVKLIRESYGQQYAVKPFTTGNVARSPLVLIGTFTGVNAERKMEGVREAYRICLALADLKTGKLVSKGLAFALPEGVDLTPLPYDRDAPAWTDDGAVTGYVRTCQGTRAGDPIHPMYIDRVVTAATLAEASEAYGNAKYADSLKLYDAALRTPGGDQLRTHTGLYLTNWRLGRRADAAKAFGQIVDRGLEANRLGVKFLFRPGTTALFSDPKVGPPAPYSMWLTQIGASVARRNACIDVVGHASASGPAAVNDRLSLLRAQFVRSQIVRTAPALAQRIEASGVGSREMMIGNGRDDVSDAIDRRVEFKVRPC